MREVWLTTNRRAIGFGMLPPAIAALVGVGLASGAGESITPVLRWLGVALVVIGGGLVVALAVHLRQPRIEYQDGRVWFYLRTGAPLDVPLEMVEAFFIGQGPTMLSSHRGRNEPTVNLVARLSRRDPQWHDREVKPALGAWDDGYVTIRGTWCERLDGELIRRLNRRLREVSEQAKANESI
jgi:hypothetical protein